MISKILKIHESLEPFISIIPETDVMLAFAAVGVMFDEICEEKNCDKNKALKMMNEVITKVNNEHGDMFCIKIKDRKTLVNVLDNYLSVDLRNQILSGLEEAAFFEMLMEED